MKYSLGISNFLEEISSLSHSIVFLYTQNYVIEVNLRHPVIKEVRYIPSIHVKKVKSESEVAQLCPTLWDPGTVAHQAPLSMGFSRQEYWSGWLFPSPGDLPDPGIKPRSPVLQADALTSEPPGKTIHVLISNPLGLHLYHV